MLPVSPRSDTRPASPRERRRYERALRGATRQLREARRRGHGPAVVVPSVDIALALRRAERRRAAEAEAQRLRDLAREARLARRRALLARLLPVGRSGDPGGGPGAVAVVRRGWRASLAALVSSLAGLWLIG